MNPSAEALINRLMKVQADAEPNLKENQDLTAELHTPSGTVIRIGQIGSYIDTDDALLVKGWHVPSDDDPSDEECAAIVPVQNFYVVFRVKTVEEPAQKQKIGFIKDPEQATL
jgi:hypothetical protein